MDDLICSECGRPNLAEAKKCWYCQSELQQSLQGDEIPLDFSPEARDSSPTREPEIQEQEEEIPQWLARIREKIEQDQGPEEELPFWKQKDIFGGEKKVTPKQSRVSKKRTSSDAAAKKSKSKGKKEDTPALTDVEIEKESENDNLSSELPEGFTKI